MQKEVIFAIILGSALGLLVAFGVFRANTALKQPVTGTNQAQNNSNNPNSTSSPNSSGLDISLSSPLPNTVVDNDSITIAGVTNSQAIVMISTPEGNWIALPAEDGSFSSEVDISAGLNQIIVYSILTNGEKVSEKINIVFTSQLAEEISENYSPKAYIGALTDITEQSLQVRSQDGEIVQISIESEDISYANIVSDSREITFEDLAIGDFIIAIGTVSSNRLLSAERILVTTEPEATNEQITLLKQSDLENYTTNRFTDVFILNPEREIEDFDLDDLEDNDSAVAIYVVDEDDEENILQTVLVLPAFDQEEAEPVL